MVGVQSRSRSKLVLEEDMLHEGAIQGGANQISLGIGKESREDISQSKLTQSKLGIVGTYIWERRQSGLDWCEQDRLCRDTL